MMGLERYLRFILGTQCLPSTQELRVGLHVCDDSPEVISRDIKHIVHWKSCLVLVDYIPIVLVSP